ncbi:hypothetical protein Q9966_016824 [Columba livia]|nr:hypothetical protein Q9966_016824 [Columba livia]
MKKPKRSPSRSNWLLSDQAQGIMANIVRSIRKQVSSEADRLRRRSRHRVAGPAHVQAALRRMVPKRSEGTGGTHGVRLSSKPGDFWGPLKNWGDPMEPPVVLEAQQEALQRDVMHESYRTLMALGE